jgi:glycosyltransferase involved in cell wall biosynthesis
MNTVKSSDALVSIILVAYNHEAFIKQAIDSIYRQTYKNFELFVADNSPNIKTFSIISDLQKEYGFSAIKQENIGAPKTLNKFIPLCNGKYIIPFSGDDYLPDYRLEVQVDFMEEHPEYMMSYGKSIWVDEKSEETSRMIHTKYKSGYIFDDLIKRKYHPPAPTYCFRKDIFEKVGMYHEGLRYTEDSYMYYKIALNYQIGFIDNYLVFQRHHISNLTYSIPIKEQLKDSKIILSEYKNYPFYNKMVRYENFSTFKFLALQKKTSKKLLLKFILLSLLFFYKPAFIRSVFRAINNSFR